MLGVALGFVIMLMLVGAGLVQVFDAYPVSYTILKVISVAYLVWLAWKIAMSPPPTDGEHGGRQIQLERQDQRRKKQCEEIAFWYQAEYDA